MNAAPAISVVLPVFNEEKNIVDLLEEIVSVFKTVIRETCEIIVVDDCSDDVGVARVEAFASRLENWIERQVGASSIQIRLLSTTVRSGQSEALLQGMSAAQGELIVTMDADGQHDPADIPRLLAAMNSCDMVCGIRKNRTDGAARWISSKIANGFRNLITGDTLTDAGCTFRVLRKFCVPSLHTLRGKLFGCEFFFHPLFLSKQGYAFTQIPVSHRARRFGKSKYQLFRGRFIRGLSACVRIRGILKRCQNKTC